MKQVVFSLIALCLAVASCDLTGPRPVAELVAISGANAGWVVGAPLPEPLVVQAVDAAGRALRGVAVEWTVTSGGGTVIPDSPMTASNGLVSASWIMGPVAGVQEVTATAGGKSVVFRVPARADVPHSLRVVPDTVRIRSLRDSAVIEARVEDRFGNRLNRQISWRWDGPTAGQVGVRTGEHAWSFTLRPPNQTETTLVLFTTPNSVGEERLEARVPILVRQELVRIRVWPHAGPFFLTSDSVTLLVPGDTVAMVAIGYDPGGAGMNVAPAWQSEAASVATVEGGRVISLHPLMEGGLVIASAPGETRIVATEAGVSGSALVRVVAPQPPPAGWAHVGRYRLLSVNGFPLPYSLQTGIGHHYVRSGGLVLEAGGVVEAWYELHWPYGLPGGQSRVNRIRGVYRAVGADSLELWEGVQGTLDGGVLTMEPCFRFRVCTFAAELRP